MLTTIIKRHTCLAIQGERAMVLVTPLLPSASFSFPQLTHRPKHPANPHFHVILRSRPTVLQLLLYERDFSLPQESPPRTSFSSDARPEQTEIASRCWKQYPAGILNPPRTASEHQGEHKDHAFRKEKPRPLSTEGEAGTELANSCIGLV